MVKSGAGWYRDAACKTSSVKLFASHNPEDILKAKIICRDCPVQAPCEKQYRNIDCVSAGKTLLERLKEKWHTIDDESKSNWK